MSKTAKKGELFVKQVLARLKGDDKEALANKISRKAISALEGQLAALKAKQVDDENKVEDAEEALENAKFPVELFTSNQAYIENVVKAQEALESAQEQLEATNKSIQYFTQILDSI